MNTRHTTPKLSGVGPFSLSRSAFLNGNVKTFFGPGQTIDDSTYNPPGDWPAAGTLLRVPQVVLLSVGSRLVPPAGKDSESQGFDTAVSDVTDEMNRVLSIFRDVRSTMATLRPNRTWVDIADFGNSSDESPPEDMITVNGGLSQIPWLRFPVTDDPFFATNFLNIWAGYAALDNSDSGFATQFVSPFGTFLSIADTNHDGSLTMRGDAADLVVSTATADDLWAAALTSAPAMFPLFPSYGSHFYYIDVDADKFTTEGGDPDEGFADSMRLGVTAFSIAAQAIAEQSAKDFGDFGFVNSGSTSPITFDSLMAEIAAFFGFDPETGLDLG